MKSKHKSIFGLLAVVGLTIAAVGAMFLMPINKTGEIAYLYIYKNETLDSIMSSLSQSSNRLGVTAVKSLAVITDYEEHIIPGRYEIGRHTNALMLFHRMSSGQQVPVRLTIPSVRTMDRLAEELSEKLMVSREELLRTFESKDSCAKYGVTPETMACIFIPETYEVYWTISVKGLIEKMKTGAKSFWNDERTRKAKALGLTPDEVITIASIVDEETANNTEKPMIAGMYYNRYRQDMPLQADPTVKFALKDFEIKRIYNNMLDVESPYNTYRNKGLPPGPIRIPSVAGIDAVLNLVKHDYLYMCAKEDFSGTHNFAKTYDEHLQNAARYSKALNDRGIE
ncbi:MAG: endolytic transglycosylase MltG [Prevotella sp.]|nr:endolytic transglycosylase MltG [Prevotella sp.]